MFDEYQFAGIMEKWIESFFSCNENFVRKKLYIFYHLFILRKKKCFYLDIFFSFFSEESTTYKSVILWVTATRNILRGGEGPVEGGTK